MKRSFILVLSLLLTFVLFIFPAQAHNTGKTLTTSDNSAVTFQENMYSGITGKATINGTHFIATANNLNPNRRYISLYYADFSTGVVNQPNTCADPRTAADVRSWNVKKEWTVRSDGSGVLHSTTARKITTLPRTITVSIRIVPLTAFGDPFLGFDPVRYPVVACGWVQKFR